MNTHGPTDRPIRVLLAEDSPVQAKLVKIIIDDTAGLEVVGTVDDGSRVLSYLRRENEFAESDQPDLVLLDVNMPTMDAFEVLREMKADPELSKVPAIVLTTSGNDRDILRSYQEGASAFIEKPLEIDKMKEVFRHFADYWSHAKLPPQQACR